MTDLYSQETPAHAGLLEKWHEASVRSVWLRPGDWYTPAAEALAEALAAGLDTAPAAARLGEARATAGVGITEAIDDMAVLFRSAGRESAPIRAIRALCEGWSIGNAPLPAGEMADPESGLGTSQYLCQRLSEVYATAQRNGTVVTETHALVMIDVAVDDTDVWQRMARNAAVGEALSRCYGDGHPMARLGDGLYAVLAERGQALGQSIFALRQHIADHAVTMRVGNLMRQPPRVWVESLPPTREYANELIASMNR